MRIMGDTHFRTDRPCVILAGAGTGKTRTITDKAVQLIRGKTFSPQQVVCVTFSNEAVASLESRLKANLEEYEMPVIRTFHGLCGDLLREHGASIGISPRFRVITPEDGMILLYQYFKIHATRCRQYIETASSLKESNTRIEEYEQYIAHAEAALPPHPEQELETLKLKLHTSTLEKPEKDALKKKIDELHMFVQQKRFLQAWRSYEKIKAKQQLLDYADLQQKALLLLQRSPALAQQIGYLIVDEFQDTNKIQLDLIHALAPKGNVTIVGDLNQSIYQFRGAYSGTFDAFKKLYAIEDITKLSNSHRSPNTVLRVAHAAIKHNYANEQDCFLVKNAQDREGDQVTLYELLNAKEEVRKIVEVIEQELQQGTKAESICVLFRTHNQATLLKRALDDKAIPYSSVRRESLLTQPLIEKIRVLSIITDKLAREGVGGGHSWWTAARLGGLSSEDLASFGKIIKEYRASVPLSRYLIDNELELSDDGKAKIKVIKAQLKELESVAKAPLMDFIGKASSLFSETIDEHERVSLKAFTTYAQEFSERESADIGTFLAHLDAREQLDLGLSMPEVVSSGAKIMTAHATKGLEYDVVIIANLVQGKFPIESVSVNKLIPEKLTMESLDQQVAEERRLFYVACTRAKQRLYLTYATQYGAKSFDPSQFLKEVRSNDNPDIRFVKDHEVKALEELATPVIQKTEIKRAITFSPSALTLFANCQKKYEYRYVFNMPEEISGREQRALGTFVHLVIDMGIKELFTSERQFLQLAEQLALKPEWAGVNMSEAHSLLKVFFERNKDKYTKDSKSEQVLFLTLDGLKFVGHADRIDFSPDGIEIIDYKTGNHVPYGKERDWQLGFYALAARRLGAVKRVTLDVFKNEKPLEYELDSKGVARDIRSNRIAFSLPQVRKELVETAQAILASYQKGFTRCPAEKSCEFCGKLGK